MKTIERRVQKLEQKKDPDQITAFDIVIFDCREQVTNPERFRKVFDSEQVSESGFKKRMYHLERI